LGHRRLDVGGTDDEVSIRTIHAALDQGINLIDTAPIYVRGAPKKSWAKPCGNTDAAKASF